MCQPKESDLMRWLVTIDAEVTLEQIRSLLKGLGVEGQDDLEPIPLDGEQVVEVEGPKDLPARASKVPSIRAVHPSSEMTLYT